MNFKSLYLGSDTSLLTKIGTITVNTFFSMRNKFVYSCSLKIHALGFNQLLQSIFFLLLIMEASSLKKLSNAWRHGSQLVRGQVNTEVEAKAYSPIHSTFEVLVVQCVVGCCHGEELSPFGWPVLAAGIAIFSASHRFAEHASQMWWFCQESERCSEVDRQQTTKQWRWPFLSAS